MKNQKISMDKTVLYMRLSREDMEKEGESASIENQRKILRRYAKEHGYAIYKEYVDDGISGTTFERPGFREMMGDVEAQGISLILIKDLSRLGRDYIQVGNYLENIFPQYHVRCIAVNDNYDSQCSDANDFMPFKNLFNEFFARDTSKKIRTTFKEKYKRGEYIGNFAPYGYQKDPLNKNHLIIDVHAADTIRRMFKLAAEGINPKAIAKLFNEEGIPSPIVYRCEVHKLDVSVFSYCKSLEWTSYGVRKMLKNICYLGHMAQGKTEKISYKNDTQMVKGRDEWIVVKNTHEPIVDEETFKIAQKRMSQRVHRPNKNFVNVFSGLAICADCGKNMSTAPTKKKGAIYNLACGRYKLYGARGCTNHFIDYDVLYGLVLASVKKQVSLTDQDKSEIINELESCSKKEEQGSRAEELKSLLNEEKKLSLLISGVYEDFYFERISKSIKESLVSKYSEKIERLKRKIKLYEAEEALQEEGEKQNKKFMELIKKYTAVTALDSELLFSLIDRIEVEQGRYEEENGRKIKRQKVKIYFKFHCSAQVIEHCV